MRKLCTIAAIGLSITAMAQKAPNPQPFANTITAEDLKKHLYIVAGPEMEGRETATEGQRKAAAYIENQFKSLGLKPSGWHPAITVVTRCLFLFTRIIR